jgi:hypothetical protein
MPTFHNFPIFGSARVTSKRAVQSIVASLVQGVEHAGDDLMGCFLPRHGVRALLKDGGRIDLVICYMCGYIQVHVPGESPGKEKMLELTTAAESRQQLNDVLRAAGVDLNQKVIGYFPQP